MKQKLSIIAGALAAFCIPVQIWAQEAPTPISAQVHFGSKAVWADMGKIQITNLQGESLGRIRDMTVDLSNGRIVEVLVVSGQTLGFGGKTIALPPRALIPDFQNKVYQVNMSLEAFAAAPAFDLSKWDESTQPDKVAAAYRYFGQAPNFLVTGEAAGRTASGTGEPLSHLGYLERTSKLLNMPINNLKGVRLGRLQSLELDVPSGRVLNVFIQTPTSANMEVLRSSETIVPPTLFSFNEKRDILLLDVSKVAYSEEPHLIIENDADGKAMSYREQPATGSQSYAVQSQGSRPQSSAALAQGTTFRDINTTAEIYKTIQSGNLDANEKVQVATIEGHVTIRGPVYSQSTKDKIAAIAIAVVRIDNVDNQIEVMPVSQAAL